MEQTDYLKDITEIRSLMERSSRFISLSGMSGVFMGLFALTGAGAAYYYLQNDLGIAYSDGSISDIATTYKDAVVFLITDAALVVICSLAAAIYFTTRKAKKEGMKSWDRTAQRLVLNISIPLAAAGIFCIALLYHGYIDLIAPCMLIFYGMALLHASKYTVNQVRFLGISEMILGLIATFFIGYGLFFWAIGFGLLHILYGVIMYYKYEKK